MEPKVSTLIRNETGQAVPGDAVSPALYSKWGSHCVMSENAA